MAYIHSKHLVVGDDWWQTFTSPLVHLFPCFLAHFPFGFSFGNYNIKSLIKFSVRESAIDELRRCVRLESKNGNDAERAWRCNWGLKIPIHVLFLLLGSKCQIHFRTLNNSFGISPLFSQVPYVALLISM